MLVARRTAEDAVAWVKTRTEMSILPVIQSVMLAGFTLLGKNK